MKTLSMEDRIILLCAFRYALGRESYAVSVVADRLRQVWELIPLHNQDQILSEIRKAIETGRAGNKIDVEEWGRVLLQSETA